MDDARYQRWDLTLKAVALLFIAIGGIWALVSYQLNSKKELRSYQKTSEKEFRRPLWDKQLSLYFDAVDSASRIAYLPDGKDREASIRQFWNLYFGPLAVVEDDQVLCTAIVEFGDCLQKPGEGDVREACDARKLQHRALLLANAARMSIGSDWDRKLDNLQVPPTKNTCRLSISPEGS